MAPWPCFIPITSPQGNGKSCGQVAQREAHGYEGYDSYDSYGTSQRISGAANGFASLEEVSACNPLPGGGGLRGWEAFFQKGK